MIPHIMLLVQERCAVISDWIFTWLMMKLTFAFRNCKAC